MNEAEAPMARSCCSCPFVSWPKSKPTLFEAQVRDFVDGGALTVHEGIELIQEELLFGVSQPAPLASGLHAAHHVLLRAGRKKG